MTDKAFMSLFVLIIVPLCCHALTSYQTNPTRTQTVTQLCVDFKSRDQLINFQDTTTAQQYTTAMKASFSATGADLIKTAFANMDKLDVILEKYPNLPQQYGIFVGPFFVGMIILIFACMCSCYCCCCPAACPPCKCCKKQMGQRYSRCQLIWPGIVLLLSLGLILAAGAIGLSKVNDLQKTISAVSCSVAITLDDLINGNVTSTGKYFVGLQTLYNQIGNMQNNLTFIDTTLTSIIPGGTGTVGGATIGASSVAKSGIDAIPTGTAAGKVPAYNYGTPFTTPSALQTLPSKMPNDLGSTNIADANSVIYVAYNGISTIQSIVNQVIGGAQGVKNTISSGFSNALNQAKKVLGGVSGTLVSGDKQYYDIFSQVSTMFPLMNTGITGVYAGLIGLASLGMLAALLLLICNFYKCRYLLYFVCIILVLIGVISFLLSMIISALIPVFYFTCDAITYAFSSGPNFNGLFGNFLPPNFSLVTVCINGESGDLLASAALGSAATSLTGLRSFLTNLNSFDAAAINTQVDNVWNPVVNLIDNYYSGKVLDFNSPSDQAILQQISQPSNYPLCTAPLFASDSWIPTAQSSAAISCKAASGNMATTTQCTATNFASGAGGCSGCMDSQIIITTFAIATTFTTDIQTRYPGANCVPFINDLTNTFSNYYTKKYTQYTNIKIRAMGTATAVNAYKTSITNVGTAFDSVISSFQSTADSIFDPTYGIIAGLNCAIVGQNLLMIVNTACTHSLLLTFFIRAAFGIAGFGVLFTVCCASCTGVRHYKQMEALKKTNADKNGANQTLQDLNQNNNQMVKQIGQSNIDLNMPRNHHYQQVLPPQNITYY